MDPTADSSEVVRTRSLVYEAFEISNFGSLPDKTKDRLVATGNVLSVPAGSTLHREGDEAAHLELVVSGLLRVYVTALDGRTDGALLPARVDPRGGIPVCFPLLDARFGEGFNRRRDSLYLRTGD